MKKVMVKQFAIMLVLLLLLPGGRQQLQAAAEMKDDASHPYLTVHYRVDGVVKQIRMGMSKAEVDKQLGEPRVLRSKANTMYEYGQDEVIVIAYKDNRVAYVDPGSAAALNSQIKYGIRWKQVIARMGQPIAVEGREYIYMYKVDKDGSIRKLTHPNQMQYAVGQMNVYSIRITVNPYDTVVGTSVWQESFRVELGKQWKLLTEEPFVLPTDWRLTTDELALVDEQGRIVVKLGMDKAEVEQHFGECDLVQFTNTLPRCFYEGVSVYYRENKAAGIVLNEASSALYTTPAGIGLLSTAQHAAVAYGESLEQDPRSKTLTFKFDQSGEYLTPVVKGGWESLGAAPSKERFVFSLLVEGDDPGYVTYLNISDEVFAYTWQ